MQCFLCIYGIFSTYHKNIQCTMNGYDSFPLSPYARLKFLDPGKNPKFRVSSYFYSRFSPMSNTCGKGGGALTLQNNHYPLSNLTYTNPLSLYVKIRKNSQRFLPLTRIFFIHDKHNDNKSEKVPG